MKRSPIKPAAMVISLTTLLYLTANHAIAHCDTMDGPVVKAAESALAEGNVSRVLLWVQKADETEIKRAFERTISVRKLGPEAKELADHYFFETLVRIHRAGEGAPYTGLKPAGTDLGPAIPVADQALKTSDVSPLLKQLEDSMRVGVRARFQKAVAKSRFQPNDVAAGREYVRAYVEFVHYVEGVHEALSKAGHDHGQEANGDASSQKAVTSETHQHSPSSEKHAHAHE